MIGDDCHIEGDVVLGAGAEIGSHNVLAAGARIFPGVDVAIGGDQVLTAIGDLNREAVASVDTGGELDDILSLPDQLRDALWRVESAGLEPHDSPGGLIVAGMGGSSIGGALARGVLGDRASRPIVVMRGYELPAWTTPDTAVLCASYSGNTEETLAVYEAAGALGARRIVATTGGKLATAARAEDVPVIPLPGGFQPRAAVAYSLVVALEVAWLCGAGERLHAEIDVAAAHLEQLVAEWGPDGAGQLPREDDRARAPRHDRYRRRRRSHGPGRVPLEDAGQREREVAVLRGPAPRA